MSASSRAAHAEPVADLRLGALLSMKQPVDLGHSCTLDTPSSPVGRLTEGPSKTGPCYGNVFSFRPARSVRFHPASTKRYLRFLVFSQVKGHIQVSVIVFCCRLFSVLMGPKWDQIRARRLPEQTLATVVECAQAAGDGTGTAVGAALAGLVVPGF